MNIVKALAKSTSLGLNTISKRFAISQKSRSMADYVPSKGNYDGVYRGKLPLYGHLGPDGAMYDLDPKSGLYEGLRGLGVMAVFWIFTYFYWDYLQKRTNRLKAEPRELPYGEEDFYRAQFTRFQEMATIRSPGSSNDNKDH